MPGIHVFAQHMQASYNNTMLKVLSTGVLPHDALITLEVLTVNRRHFSKQQLPVCLYSIKGCQANLQKIQTQDPAAFTLANSQATLQMQITHLVSLCFCHHFLDY